MCSDAKQQKTRRRGDRLTKTTVVDASKAEEKLGWKPRTSFAELAKIMVESDWERARRERILASGRAA